MSTTVGNGQIYLRSILVKQMFYFVLKSYMIQNNFILLLLPYCIIFLQAVNSLQRADAYSQRMTLKFLKYAQSSQCENMNDSSVSYAAGALTFE